MDSVASYINDIQSNGRYDFTFGELSSDAARGPDALRAALRRLKRDGRIVSPRQGYFVIVPLEYKAAGTPPPSWFIDNFMGYLGQVYYVALLSAAAIHGAAHQQPMIMQIMTDRPTRSARAGRTRIDFHVSRDIHAASTIDVQTETGTMNVSTPETTAFDLVRYLDSSGGVENVIDVLNELSDRMNSERLRQHGSSYRTPDIQRLGFLLSRIERTELAEPLAQILNERRFRRIPLEPGMETNRLVLNSEWRILHDPGMGAPV